jgi:hypothetical protein
VQEYISLSQQPCTSGTKDDDPILNHHFSLCCIRYNVRMWTELRWPSDSLLKNEILMLVIMKANSLLGQDATQSRNSYRTARNQVTEGIFFKAINIWAPAMVGNFVTSKTTTSFTFILVINQLYAQNLFYNKFNLCLYMFRAPCAHRQEVKIVLYSL